MIRRVVLCVLLSLAGLSGWAPHAQAQQPVTRNADAELMFDQGVAAFEAGNYQDAFERFRLVAEYPVNQRTTAALLMAGRALYRQGKYRQAQTWLNRLLRQYPSTSYRDEAERVLRFVDQGLQQYGARPDTLRIGVALPMGDQQVSLSQALFNGLRLAAEQHNGVRRRFILPPGLQQRARDSVRVYDTAALDSDSLAAAEGRLTLVAGRDTVRLDSMQVVTEQVRTPAWVAKLYFRASGTTPQSARAAVDSLIRIDRVDLIVGPLYSRTARAAGAVAEAAGVILVAPLATDASVSIGRQHVFQTNPTMPMRGRVMAQFVRDGLMTNTAGIIYEADNTLGAQMARGFIAQSRVAGVNVAYELRLPNARSWSRLPEAFATDSTVTDSMRASAEVVYLPISGRNATGRIQEALIGLDRLSGQPRVLGNAEWHDLAIEKMASRFLATYTNDFYVDPARPAVQDFIRSYRLLTGAPPSAGSVAERRLAYTGYDVATFLMQTLTPGLTRPAPATLRNAARYEGLGMRIDFAPDSNVNGAMFIHRYRNGQIELVR
ncbi:ABC transporter substrate-binding protein [Salisaeta longa]|uniref:ABC transporter substrate-binding protein n=1 Tax=Salisaeta longa TaxID=503170 RepID=UPI00058E5D3E|nr:ABC transporter substrate-binding protein [Salisaeta longa]